MNNKPIYIYEGGGLNPEIIGTIDTDPYATHDSRALFAKMSKRVNNVTALEVTISANSEAAKTITNTSDLVVYDNQGEVHECHITELVYIDEYSQELQIYAEESICELVNNIVTGEGQSFPTTKNPSDYLNYILFYTRFTVGVVDTGIYDSQWKENITGKNCLEALQLFIEKYNCEFQVRYTTDNKNRITGRYIDIKTQIGNSYGKRFEDDKDILKLSQKLNLDSVKTAIYPRIAKTVTDEASGESVTVYDTIADVEWSVNNGNPANKPRGETILKNPDASAMLKRLNSKDGSLMERVMYAEWDEESCPNGPESLIGQAWAILRANSVLVPSLEVSATDLYRLSGENPDYSHELVSIGDECTIVDKSFDEPIRLELRVMEIYEDLLNPVNTEYNFGKYRRTLATSNLEQQESLEEKIDKLQALIKGPVVAKPQYQGGKPYYEGISEEVQNAFMEAEGYTFISDSEGLWVFDKPQSGGPTKAVILKGGQLAIAKYNFVTNEWKVSTFIDGDSINASMINTGKISANLIEANSITTEHLAAGTVSEIKTGMVTEDQFNQTILDLADTYVSFDDLGSEVGTAVATRDVALVRELQRQLKAEYEDAMNKCNQILADTHLPPGSTARAELNNAMVSYTSAYTALDNKITELLLDSAITDEEFASFGTLAEDYSTAYQNLATAAQNANDARLANVYAQSQQGLVTKTSLEVTENKIVAKAQQGMVNTGDLTSAITLAKGDMVNITTDAIDSAVENVRNETNVAIDNAVKDKVDINQVEDAIKNTPLSTRNLALLTSGEYITISGFTEDGAKVEPSDLKYKVLAEVSEKDPLIVAFDYKLTDVTYSDSVTPSIKFKGPGNVVGWNTGYLPQASVSLTDKPANREGTAFIGVKATANHAKNDYWSGFIEIIGITGGSVAIKGVRVFNSAMSSKWVAAPEDATTESIRRTYQAISTEYKLNVNSAERLLNDKYLAGTAKTNLNGALTAYKNKFTGLTNKRNDIINNCYATKEMLKAWNSAIVALQDATEALGKEMQNAQTFINTAVYNASVQYFEDTIPDKLTGYAKQSYVDEAKQAAITAAKEGMVSTTELTTQVDAILATTASMGQYNLLRNTDFRAGMDFWSVYRGKDSSADKVTIESDPNNKSGLMSGERALCIWGTAAETGNKNIVAYQDVVLTPGVSYTLAYWVNCSDCSMKMSIKSVNESNVVSEVALKTYKNINGDHNRTTWKYDSLSFTVPTGSAKMRVTMTLTNATTGTYRAFLVKPMLSTGINAQAWTGHPDEMHIGVVSITEEKGIMVEHSDTNTYSTLNSKGLQVWDRNSSTPVAYFGEGQTAYVPTISTDMVYSKSVTPQLFIDRDITIYFSDSGSGNASGVDKNNPARGFTGAMAVLCDMLGIDNTHITGGFTVTSATPVINTIKFIAVGTNLYSGIYLQNISGAVNIEIEFPKDMALRGTYVFRCISCPIWIRGNKTNIFTNDGAVVKRVYDSNAGSFNSGMIFYNCSAAELTSMRFFCADNSHQAGVEVWYSNIYIGNTDIKGWAHGIYIIQESTVYSHNNCGVSGTSGIKVNNGIISVSGAVPKTSRISSDNYRDHMVIQNASMVGTGSQAPKSKGTIQGSYSNTSRSFNIKGVPLWYESIRGNYKIKDLYQGSADNSETDKYVGRIYLPSTFQDAMISASGISMAIYLERNGNIHGDESADVYIDGYSVGSLKRGEGKWFNLPDTTVTAIRSGSRSYIELNGTSYIMFVRYAQISLSATKTV